MHHIHAVPQPLIEAIDGFTQRSLSDFVARMLAKVPEERPEAGEVYDVLTAEFALYTAQNPGAAGRFIPASAGRKLEPAPARRRLARDDTGERCGAGSPGRSRAPDGAARRRVPPNGSSVSVSARRPGCGWDRSRAGLYAAHAGCIAGACTRAAHDAAGSGSPAGRYDRAHPPCAWVEGAGPATEPLRMEPGAKGMAAAAPAPAREGAPAAAPAPAREGAPGIAGVASVWREGRGGPEVAGSSAEAFAREVAAASLYVALPSRDEALLVRAPGRGAHGRRIVPSVAAILATGILFLLVGFGVAPAGGDGRCATGSAGLPCAPGRWRRWRGARPFQGRERTGRRIAAPSGSAGIAGPDGAVVAAVDEVEGPIAPVPRPVVPPARIVAATGTAQRWSSPADEKKSAGPRPLFESSPASGKASAAGARMGEKDLMNQKKTLLPRGVASPPSAPAQPAVPAGVAPPVRTAPPAHTAPPRPF